MQLWSTMVNYVNEVSTSFSGVTKVMMAQTASASRGIKKGALHVRQVVADPGPPAVPT